MHLEPERSQFARWVGAGVFIVALHIATVSSAMRASDDDQLDETAGAIAIEIATETTALAVEPLDVAPGPQMDESMPSQHATEQLSEKVENEIKEDLPAPVPNPEIVLQRNTPVERAEEPKQAEPEQEGKAPDQAVAAQTTAPPSVDARIAQTAATPQMGTSTEAAKSILSWHRAVAMHLNKNKRYPTAARQRGIQGEAHVKFMMDRSGQLTTVEITRSSGSSLLDSETLELLQRAAPFPRPPTAAQGESFELNVPIRFRIND